MDGAKLNLLMEEGREVSGNSNVSVNQYSDRVEIIQTDISSLDIVRPDLVGTARWPVQSDGHRVDLIPSSDTAGLRRRTWQGLAGDTKQRSPGSQWPGWMGRDLGDGSVLMGTIFYLKSKFSISAVTSTSMLVWVLYCYSYMLVLLKRLFIIIIMPTGSHAPNTKKWFE